MHEIVERQLEQGFDLARAPARRASATPASADMSFSARTPVL